MSNEDHVLQFLQLLQHLLAFSTERQADRDGGGLTPGDQITDYLTLCQVEGLLLWGCGQWHCRTTGDCALPSCSSFTLLTSSTALSRAAYGSPQVTLWLWGALGEARKGSTEAWWMTQDFHRFFQVVVWVFSGLGFFRFRHQLISSSDAWFRGQAFLHGIWVVWCNFNFIHEDPTVRIWTSKHLDTFLESSSLKHLGQLVSLVFSPSVISQPG